MQPDMCDHKIFSRTFDLTHKKIPDVNVDRQAIGCRRTTWNSS